jgi:hypothetical protein
MNEFLRKKIKHFISIRIKCVVTTIAIFYGVPTYVASYDFFACNEFLSIKNPTISIDIKF